MIKVSDYLRCIDLPSIAPFIWRLEIERHVGFQGKSVLDEHRTILGKDLVKIVPNPSIVRYATRMNGTWLVEHNLRKGTIELHKRKPYAVIPQVAPFDHVCMIKTLYTRGYINLKTSEDIFDFLTT